METSPFSGGLGWELKLKIVPTKWTGVEKIFEESSDKERDIKLVKYIYNCQFLTAVQIMQAPIWQMYTGVDKKYINLLARGGYLVKHNIFNKGSVLPIYSAGPGAYFKNISDTYKTNFYRNYGLTTVLKILSVNQLFLRMLKFAYARISFNILPPYTAEIYYIEKRHGPYLENKDKEKTLRLISLRNYTSDVAEMKRQLPKVDDKAVIIAHDLTVLEELTQVLADKDNFRYTSDGILFREKLANAFYMYNNKKMVQTYLQNFDENINVALINTSLLL